MTSRGVVLLMAITDRRKVIRLAGWLACDRYNKLGRKATKYNSVDTKHICHVMHV